MSAVRLARQTLMPPCSLTLLELGCAAQPITLSRKTKSYANSLGMQQAPRVNWYKVSAIRLQIIRPTAIRCYAARHIGPMATFHTVVPLYNLYLNCDATFQFAVGLRLTAIPGWLRSQNLLQSISQGDREAIEHASHCFLVTYEADSLGALDAAHTGLYPRSMQDAKYELAVLGNLALWLSKPTPACFATVVHAPQFGAEPVAQQVARYTELLCHPQDVEARLTAADVDRACTIHAGLASVTRSGSVFNAIWATWAALQMNSEAIRYVLFWIALEALFGPEDAREINYRLAQRVGFFLAASRVEAKELFAICKKGYSVRSKIVHGRWREDPENTTRMAETETLVRRCLTKVVASEQCRSTFSGSGREAFLDELVFRDGGITRGSS
jgi:hypothetical protein